MENATVNEVMDEVVETEAVEAVVDKKDIKTVIPKPVKIIGGILLLAIGAAAGVMALTKGNDSGYSDITGAVKAAADNTVTSDDFAEAD